MCGNTAKNATGHHTRQDSGGDLMNLEEWLNEADRIRFVVGQGFYNNPLLGTPKFDNGFDRLFKLGLTPQEALIMWRDYR